MTPAEMEAHRQREASRAAARAKWADGSAKIENHDLAFFSGDEIMQLINAGRIEGIGRDKRLAR